MPAALFITPTIPAVAGNGLAMRAGVTLEGLASRFVVDLCVVPIVGDGIVSDWVRGHVRHVYVLEQAYRDPLFDLLWAIGDDDERRTALAAYPRPGAARWSVPRATARAAEQFEPPDLVYALRLALAPFAGPWLRRGGPPLVLDLDEDDVAKCDRFAALLEDCAEAEAAAAERAEAAKFRRLRDEWLGAADLVVAAAEGELAEPRQRRLRARPVPNPTPPRRPGTPVAPVDLVFVGNLAYPPNADAIDWLCEEVAPVLTDLIGRRPSIALVGQQPDEETRALAGEGVIVVPDPPTVTPWYEAATVAVVPLRVGGGTRLKLLEAMDHRRPVVTTSIGCEGLPVTDGIDVLIADRPAEFAAACARLLTDAALRNRLVRAAGEVAHRFAWSRVASVVADVAEAAHRAGRVAAHADDGGGDGAGVGTGRGAGDQRGG